MDFFKSLRALLAGDIIVELIGEFTSIFVVAISCIVAASLTIIAGLIIGNSVVIIVGVIACILIVILLSIFLFEDCPLFSVVCFIVLIVLGIIFLPKINFANSEKAGNSYFENGNYEKAIESYTRAIKKHPKNTSVQQNIAASYFKIGNYPQAIKYYNDFLAIEPNNNTVRRELADAYSANNQYNEAFTELKKLNMPRAELVDTLVKQGNAGIDGENYTAAIAAYTEAITLDNNARNAILSQANSCYEQAKFRQAAEIYDFILDQIDDTGETLDLNSILMKSYTSKAGVYFLQEDFASAIDYINKALDINPDDPDILDKRAYFYLQTKDYDRAVADYTRCIELNPSSEYYFSRANAYIDSGKSEESLPDFTFLIENDENLNNVADARIARGMVYLKAKDYSNSIKDFSDYLRYKAKPAVPIVYILRSDAYRESGMIDKAVEDLNKADTYDADSLKEFDMSNRFAALAAKIYDKAGGEAAEKAFMDTLGNKLNKDSFKTAPMPIFPVEYNGMIDCLEKAVFYDNENEIKSKLSNWLLARAQTRHLNNEFRAAVTDYEKVKELAGDLDKGDKARLKYASKEKGILGGFWDHGFGRVLFWILIVIGILVVIVIVTEILFDWL